MEISHYHLCQRVRVSFSVVQLTIHPIFTVSLTLTKITHMKSPGTAFTFRDASIARDCMCVLSKTINT